jgi:hypothetical protein
MIFAYDEKQEIEANLKRVGGQEVVQRARLKTQANGAKAQVVWALPAKALDEADYIINIKGADERGEAVDVERYAFRIIKK